MSLLDIFTGGAGSSANGALRSALDNLSSVPVPTAQQLSIPELEQYVQAGILTPAQAKAYLQESNTYDQAKLDPSTWAAQLGALNQLSQVANMGAEGTPVERAQQAHAEEQANRSLAGNIGAIEQAAEARGVPLGLMQAALETQMAGQAAENQNQADLEAQSQAYQNALAAMSKTGELGGQMQNEQQNWQQAVANAGNAMQQFNAQNRTQVSEANANREQQANVANQQIRQNVSNQNVQQNNARTAYNAQLPQQVFEDKYQKATGAAGIANNQANAYQQQGQQQAGLMSGLIGAGANIAGNYALAGALGPAGAAAGATLPNVGANPNYGGAMADGGIVSPYPNYMAEGGMVPHARCYHDGGMCMEEGGTIPGQAEVPGDSLKNDTVPIMASPGEAVIPRTVVQSNPGTVLGLLSQRQPEIDPHDVATILRAMHELRGA